MNEGPLELDVRPVLKNGEEPLALILSTINRLAPGQELRLFAPFMPEPLISLLEGKGYGSLVTELDGGDWEVLFTPQDGHGSQTGDTATPHKDKSHLDGPTQSIDLRELLPPEPMVEILTALESMAKGEQLEAMLDREPALLFPELTKRGHSWNGSFDANGETYVITITSNGLQP